MIPENSFTPSFPQRRESSEINTPQRGQNRGVDSLGGKFLFDWIPAFAGMTGFRPDRQPGMIRAMRSSARQTGFTMVEMIMVMVITGIIGGMVAMFIRAPVQGYMDSARRAEMTDIADTAIRRMTRDLRLALPNSVRVWGTCDGATPCFIEFLPTTGGGRYRIGLPGDTLDFNLASDNSFDVLGQPVAANAGDSLVIYNMGNPTGTCDPAVGAGLDAYEGCNRRAIVSGGANITFTATANPFPFDSCQFDPVTGDVVSGCRFQVVQTPVTYMCNPVAGGAGGTLTRYWGYAIQATQPADAAAAPLSAATNALLATNVGACNFTYNANVVAQRSGLVTMGLTITEPGSSGNESVSLYSATHVSNVP
jgi:MSHA biogenesis protein MshO